MEDKESIQSQSITNSLEILSETLAKAVVEIDNR